MQHWPTMRPPAPLKARWIFPRCFVCASRISHVLSFAKIKSNQGFFTTSNIFVERRKALLLPANVFFCPVVVLPLLPWTPLPLLLPLLPWTPLPLLLPPPRHAFRCELANDAFFLKQAVQNFARGEAASFLQPGLLHFLFAFFAMAAPGKLKTSTSNLNMNGYGTSYTCVYSGMP